MVLIVLWINSSIISNLREGNRQQLEKIAKSYSQSISNSTDEELKFIINTLLPSLNFPIVITSGDEIYATMNIDIPIDDSNYSTEIWGLVEKMDETFKPFDITRTNDSGEKILVSKIHYGDQKIIKTISVLPYLELGFAFLFISISAFGFQLIRANERNSIYAGMARETAHQLGTPISSLLGWVELLKEKMLVKKRNDILRSMKKDLDRLSEISDRFSKIGSKVNLKKINLKSLLEKVTLYMVERLPKSSKTDILLSCQKNISIMGDPVLLSWAFENIIKNSIDAIEKDEGKISVTMSIEDKNISILFKDNGRGIKRNDWNNIFKPGFSTKKRGWGLGLSLTQRIIKEIHKGDILVTDSSQEGTMIKISLLI
tara:strand:- start:680 stop:1795 length:1116 start_codon:yes stop_codon:yes gene_type:complete